MLTITDGSNPYCGQTGRVCRVFWRDGVPWVLTRCKNGMLLSLPWGATDLPVPVTDHDPAPDPPFAVLLAPAALLALVRFLRHRAEDTTGADVTTRGAR